MDPRHRHRFDELLESVLDELPPMVHQLIEKVPLHVEDYPSKQVLATTGVRRRSELCGLYTGIPLTERSVLQSGTLPDVVTIYREGVLAAATRPDGRIPTAELRRQIRITILHELAHHHGLDEEELRRLGYE
ncbi:MAG: metallopeptidase family protein [Pirellulales bacterium]|nr:metallopeptidase family protein [Pirellulales bacterium]